MKEKMLKIINFIFVLIAPVLSLIVGIIDNTLNISIPFIAGYFLFPIVIKLLSHVKNE